MKSNSFPLWQLNVKSNSFPLGQLRLVRVVSQLGLIRQSYALSYVKLSFPVETSTYCLSLILLILLRCIRRDLFFMNIFRGFKDKSFHNLHSPPPQHCLKRFVHLVMSITEEIPPALLSNHKNSHRACPLTSSPCTKTPSAQHPSLCACCAPCCQSLRSLVTLLGTL